jgi:hypothetical protein
MFQPVESIGYDIKQLVFNAGESRHISKGNDMSKAPGSKAPPARSFPSTPAGREKAYQQAQRQGEPTVTFKVPTSKPSKSK